MEYFLKRLAEINIEANRPANTRFSTWDGEHPRLCRYCSKPPGSPVHRQKDYTGYHLFESQTHL